MADSNQKRYFDYGKPANADDQNAAQSHFARQEAGVLYGARLSANSDGDRLLISAGGVITHSGVILTEDAEKYLTFPITSDQKSYTVVLSYTYTRIAGGTQGTLSLVDDIKAQADVGYGVVIGWVVYPGSSVNLETYMCYSADMKGLHDRRTASDRWVGMAQAPFVDSRNMFIEYNNSLDYVKITHALAENSSRVHTTWLHTSANEFSFNLRMMVPVTGPFDPTLIQMAYTADGGPRLDVNWTLYTPYGYFVTGTPPTSRIPGRFLIMEAVDTWGTPYNQDHTVDENEIRTFVLDVYVSLWVAVGTKVILESLGVWAGPLGDAYALTYESALPEPEYVSL